MVAKYLREQGFWMADRRLREGRTDDQGDIDGVPYTTIQVKYVAANRMPAWVTDTLKQRENAGTPYCLLVVRTKYRGVEGWDAYLPAEHLGLVPGGDIQEAWTWIRMDLRMAVVQLKALIEAATDVRGPWVPSSPTTSMGGLGKVHVTRASSSVPSMERATPPSATA